jgi:D-cysteine desulfhydrase
MATQRTIFDRFPGLEKYLPLEPLGEFPTPVHRVTDLERALGIDRLWIKRDDISAKTYGGNKIRKLEFLLAAAKETNCDTVITFGGFGSNHALATSIYAKQLGLNCVAILTPGDAYNSRPHNP